MTEISPDNDGWFFWHPDAVPELWRSRAITVSFVPLLPGEAKAFTEERRVTVEIRSDEIDIARLAAEGLSANEISRRLRVPLRTIQRRMARMRDRFGLPTAGHLKTYLAKRGWASGGIAATLLSKEDSP